MSAYPDSTAATHLSRLGVNPVTVARLREYADEDGMTLREFVAYVLSSYEPPYERPADEADDDQ